MNDLLISRRKPHIRYEPFPYFCVDDYLPPKLYAALYDEFPSVRYFDGSNRAGKMALNPRTQSFKEFLASSPRWAQVLEALPSDEFLKDVEVLLRRGLVRARGVAGLRGWRNHDRGRKSVPLVQRPVEFSCEFSRLPRGAYLYPHTDKPEKLVSFLLYFADPGWDPGYGGSTDLYRVKYPRHDCNWSGRAVTFDAVDLVFRSEFRPNRLLVFVKTRNSYHGVSPISCPDGLTRNSFNFNVIIPRDRWGRRGKALLDSYRWRTERWRFREFAEAIGQA